MLDLNFEPIEGDVKVVRDDDRNFAVQRYVAVDIKESGARGGKKTGEKRLEWKTLGYFGERPESLVAAAKCALAAGANGRDTRELIASIERAERSIRQSIKQLLEGEKA